LNRVSPLITALVAAPAVQARLERAWHAAQPAETADLTAQRQGLERAAQQARQRLTQATEMVVDGVLDKDGYDGLVAKARADLDAADAELARLTGTPAQEPLPALGDVLAALGGWAAALSTADIPAQRDVLAVLVDHIIPMRLVRGKYDVEIAWTLAGAAL